MMPRLTPLLRLVRLGTLFSPAADVVASAAVLGLPWSTTVVRAAIASAALYAGGMVWNDIADRHLDAVQRPERPLPRGEVSLAFAGSFAVLLFAIGIGLSPCRAHHGLIAALILVYDFGGKFQPWLGALNMGLLRALNLFTASHLTEVVDDARQHSLLIAAICYGVYIVAVTMLGHFEDQPKVRGRAVAAVQTAPPLVALCALASVQGSWWPAPAIFAVPAVWFLRRNTRIRDWTQAAMRRSMLFLLLGTMLYTASLALAADRPIEALAIAGAIVPARWIARRIALT